MSDKPSSQPKVSVVVPAFNEESLLGETLDNISSQDYQSLFEIIVCDNNSTDHTVEIAKSKGVTVVSETRKGTRFAYDTGMRAAAGELILVTNADVRLPQNWISSIVKVYEDPWVVGVGTNVLFYDAPGYINSIKTTLDRLSPKHAMWGTSLSCRKSVFEKVGGFNHGVNTNEDAIFTLLIEKLGKVVYLNDVTVWMNGRRFNNGPLSAAREWFKGFGLNSLYIQFHYLLTGEIKSLIKDFDDIRPE